MDRSTVDTVCEVCCNTFEVVARELKRGKGRTCSTRCAGQLGKVNPQEITKDLLHHLFFIDFENGSMKWRNPPRQKRHLTNVDAGAVKQFANGRQQVVIMLYGRKYLRSRLMYLAYYGVWPIPCADHKNRDPLDDRIDNLREATKVENGRNMRRPDRVVNGVTVPMGIRLAKSGKFTAGLKFKGKYVSFGTYDSMTTAIAVYSEKRKELFGDFA